MVEWEAARANWIAYAPARQNTIKPIRQRRSGWGRKMVFYSFINSSGAVPITAPPMLFFWCQRGVVGHVSRLIDSRQSVKPLGFQTEARPKPRGLCS